MPDWVLAYAVEDPQNTWEDESEALSCPDAGNARCGNLAPNVWSGYLVWLFKPTLANEIEISFYIPTFSWEYEIDRYDGGQWVSIKAGMQAGDTWPMILSIPAATISQIRLRVRHFHTKSRNADAFCCRIRLTCRGPLCPICTFLSNARVFFGGLADDIADWAIVGDALSAPFRLLSEICNNAAGECCTASAVLQDILDAIEGSFTWAGFLALLQDYAPTLYYLIVDPVGEVLYLIGQAFDIDPWHLQSFEFLTKYILQTYLPTLYDLWLDPMGEIVRWLAQYSSFLAGLFIDPAKQIRWTVGEILGIMPGMYDHPEVWPEMLLEGHFPELYLIWRDPDGWLLARLGPILDAILEVFKDLLELSWDTLLDLYEDTFEAISARLYSLVERTVRFFWEGEW